MMHKNRRWSVVDATPADLARTLAGKDNPEQMTWCSCNGFRVGPTVWLNDSTGPEGIQEYAIVDTASGRQIESITVSWCDPARIQEYAEGYANGTIEPFPGGQINPAQIETPDQHGRCAHCA